MPFDSDELEKRKGTIRKRLSEIPSVSQFKKSIKKIRDEHLLMKILAKVEEVLNDYTYGNKKTGNLAGIRAVKVEHQNVSYRLIYIAYSDENSEEINILFIYFGKREECYNKIRKIFNGNTSLDKLRKEGK